MEILPTQNPTSVICYNQSNGKCRHAYSAINKFAIYQPVSLFLRGTFRGLNGAQLRLGTCRFYRLDCFFN